MAPFEIRELFHLVFLRNLCSRLSGRPFAVKGGICLRFFHRSPRLSEDIDLDAGPKLRRDTLEKTVDTVLQGPALQSSLVAAGVLRLSFSKPKQTETTQRWKVALTLSADSTLPTKIEFSRRSLKSEISRSVPDHELLRLYRLPAFGAPHYGSLEMVIQKIHALAAPSRYALRDLFDLHHLLSFEKIDLAAAEKKIPRDVVMAAGDKVNRFSFDDFGSQVVPYLTPEMVSLYQNASAFENLKSETRSHLQILEER